MVLTVKQEMSGKNIAEVPSIPRRRSKPEVFADILKSINNEIKANEVAKMTAVSKAVSIPYGRFQTYVYMLAEKGLVQINTVGNHEELSVTAKGKQFLVEFEEKYLNALKFLETFSLT